MTYISIEEFTQKSERILFDFYNDRAKGEPWSIDEEELRAELKKLEGEYILSKLNAPKVKERTVDNSVVNDTISALVNLGFNKTDAKNAVSQVDKSLTRLDDVFKKALEYLRK